MIRRIISSITTGLTPPSPGCKCYTQSPPTSLGWFGLILANLRDRYALVIPSNKAASLMMTPAQLPFPALQSFNVEGKLSADGTLTAHVQHTTRGDAEVIFRSGFRSVSPAQWKELEQRVSYGSGFSGDVDNVTVSAPDATNKPFQISYRSEEHTSEL